MRKSASEKGNFACDFELEMVSINERIDYYVAREFRMGALHEIIYCNVEIPPWKPKVKFL